MATSSQRPTTSTDDGVSIRCSYLAPPSSRSNKPQAQIDPASGSIYSNEEVRLTELLVINPTEIDHGGTLAMQPPVNYAQCGKRSGFDDFVHNGIVDGNYSEKFIIDMLRHPEKNKASPPHFLKSMNCGIYYGRIDLQQKEALGTNFSSVAAINDAANVAIAFS